MKTSRKKIKKYIRISTVGQVFIWVLLLTALVTFLIGGYFTVTAGRESMVEFDPVSSPGGEYCYLDVVGVSNWLYKTNRDGSEKIYYAVEDAEGYVYIASIPEKEHRKMTAQTEYWLRESSDAPIPEPYRLKGVSYGLYEGSEVRESLAYSLDVDKGEEFERYFGKWYLNGGVNPREQRKYGYWLASLFSGLFGIIVLYSYLGRIRNTGKSLKALEKSGKLSEAAEELEAGDGSFGCVVSEHYMFVRRYGIAVPVDSITKCRCSGSMVWLETTSIGKTTVQINSVDTIRKIVDALPMNKEAVEISVTLSK